jgi:ATP-binding cassette subfamily B protein
MDCGPSCLLFISQYHGKKYPLNYLRELCQISRQGVSLKGINVGAISIGFNTLPTTLSIEKLIEMKPFLPCILHWDQNHFVVLKKIDKIKYNVFFTIMDPRIGSVKLPVVDLEKSWLSASGKGTALFVNTSEIFYNKEIPKVEQVKWISLLKYLKPHKRKFIGLSLSVLFGAMISLVLPFLTKALIDEGITKKDIGIVKLILFAQLALFLGSLVISVVRNWITLFLGTNLNIKLITDFIHKLVKLPMRHFDTQMIGDLNQRIVDNERIERLLTSESVSIFFSIITFFIFSAILIYFNVLIFTIYTVLTILSILWSAYWLKKRKTLDFHEFQIKSKNQESIFEIFSGIRDLKLYQLENYKLNKWKSVRNELLDLQMKMLKIDQLQGSGYQFINQLKNIFVTYFAANLVIKGEMTLGMLLSISYIIGEMNGPISQFVNFLRRAQDGKLSFKRLSEINKIAPEDSSNQISLPKYKVFKDTIKVENLNFSYNGDIDNYVLKNINLVIENKKVTAIVGHSGSGKTTLMKILLKFYDPTTGNVFFNNVDSKQITSSSLRENVGTVLQDGFIFSESIERNVITGNVFEKNKFKKALKTACIYEFVNSLPKKEKTIIGSLGNNISTGQKQRFLIARALYKNPEYLFLDEATSALDSKTEKNIHNNLKEYFKLKTVVVIAHRLSTVKNADKIIVLDNGSIAEIGNHKELIELKGNYYDLICNQLEIEKL